MITCHIFSDSFPENLSGTGLSHPAWFQVVCSFSLPNNSCRCSLGLHQHLIPRYFMQVRKMNILIKRFLNSKIPLRSTNFRADMQKMAFRKTKGGYRPYYYFYFIFVCESNSFGSIVLKFSDGAIVLVAFGTLGQCQCRTLEFLLINFETQHGYKQSGEFYISHDASRLISGFSPRWKERSRVSREISNDLYFKVQLIQGKFQ